MNYLSLEKHPGLTSHQAVVNICQPLNDAFNIDYFTYIHINKKSHNRVLLTTKPEWVMFFYKNQYHYHPIIVRSEFFQKNGYYIWNDYQEETPFSKGEQYFQILSGITIVNSNDQDANIYCFGSAKEANRKDPFYYLNIIEALERFIIYFHDKARKLIHSSNQKAIYIPPTFNVDQYNDTVKKINLDEFLNIKHIKRFYIRDMPLLQNTYLTQKEAECALHYLNGKNARETADTLYCSSRTVEIHIENIKRKLQCDTKLQLIHLLINHVFNPSFLADAKGC